MKQDSLHSSNIKVSLLITIALLTTTILNFILFGWMWSGFSSRSYWPAIAYLWIIGSLSGGVCGYLGAHKRLIELIIISILSPVMFLAIITMGAIEDFRKNNSYESLATNWPLLVAPIGIFIVQITPAIILSFFTRRIKI